MRYLVSGYYGEGNAGDEAILAGIIKAISEQDPGASFLVLSFCPSDTERRHKVEAISTSLRRPARLLAAMHSADVLLSGGGSILHEADFDLYGRHFLFRAGKLRPIPYFLSIVMMARAVGLPVMWYAQGLGPLHTASARLAVKMAGSASQILTWRDREAAALAYECGIEGPLQRVVPDPAYALSPADPTQAWEVLGRAGVPAGAPLLMVCPRPWLRHTSYLDALVAGIAEVAERDALWVVFLAFQDRTDGPLCDELAARPALAGRAAAVRGVEDPGLLASLLSQALVAVTVRLHAGILAATAGTPTVAVVYDPKVDSFARQTRQERFLITVDQLESEEGPRRLAALLDETIRKHDQRRAELLCTVGPLRLETASTARLAVDLARRRIFATRRRT